MRSRHWWYMQGEACGKQWIWDSQERGTLPTDAAAVACAKTAPPGLSLERHQHDNEALVAFRQGFRIGALDELDHYHQRRAFAPCVGAAATEPQPGEEAPG